MHDMKNKKIACQCRAVVSNLYVFSKTIKDWDSMMIWNCQKRFMVKFGQMHCGHANLYWNYTNNSIIICFKIMRKNGDWFFNYNLKKKT